jgi:PIN domain nuclease of toxin-antitoxin system
VTGLVLDTSAVLAVVFEEAGEAVVRAALASASPPLISSVNLAEAIGQLARRRGWAAADSLEFLLAIGLEVAPFGAADAAEAGRLEPLLVRRGISLGDRACLALAGLRGLPVLTADRAWTTLGLPIEVRLLR